MEGGDRIGGRVKDVQFGGVNVEVGETNIFNGPMFQCLGWAMIGLIEWDLFMFEEA